MKPSGVGWILRAFASFSKRSDRLNSEFEVTADNYALYSVTNATHNAQFTYDIPDASMSPRTDWRYRFGPMKEREQKRLYATDDDPTASLPWVYYLLSGNKQQLAVYNGIEGRPCGGVVGSVYM